MNHVLWYNLFCWAELLELADRYDSGSYVGNDVRVQVPYSASRNEIGAVASMVEKS